jgi:hypothetical protein
MKTKTIIYSFIAMILLIGDIVIVGLVLGNRGLFHKKGIVLPDYASENINITTQNPKYISTGLDISLEMPVSFHLAAGLDLSGDFFQAMTYDDTAAYDPNTKGIKLEILNFPNKKELPLIEWVGHSAYYQEGVPDFIEVALNNKPALMQETVTVSSASRTYVVGYQKKVYIIDFSGDKESYNQYLADIESTINSLSFL